MCGQLFFMRVTTVTCLFAMAAWGSLNWQKNSHNNITTMPVHLCHLTSLF